MGAVQSHTRPVGDIHEILQSNLSESSHVFQILGTVESTRAAFEASTDLRFERPVDHERLALDAQHLGDVLGAGVLPSKGSLFAGSLEEVAALSMPVSDVTKRVEATLHSLGLLHQRCRQERAAAAKPYLHALMRARADAEQQDLHQAVLAALSALAGSFSRASAGPEAAALASAHPRVQELVRDLSELLSDFQPRALFGEWSPAELGPETVLPRQTVDPRRCYASGPARKLTAPEPRLFAPLNSGYQLHASHTGDFTLLSPTPIAWRADSKVGVAVWGIAFAGPTAISSIKLWLRVSATL